MPRKKSRSRVRKPPLPRPKYRNKILNAELDHAHAQFCGVGLHRVKNALQARSQVEPKATAYLLALEIEALSRRAKRQKGDAQQRLYKTKRARIRDLLTLCQEEGYDFAIQTAPDSGQAHVVYLYLPGCEQISWHTSLDTCFPPSPDPPAWDGKKYSALRKLEAAIQREFPDLLKNQAA